MSGENLSVDHRNEGFSCRVTARQARRQLKVSLGVVTMLAIGIVSAAVTVGAHPVAAKRDVAAAAAMTRQAGAVEVGAKSI